MPERGECRAQGASGFSGIATLPAFCWGWRCRVPRVRYRLAAGLKQGCSSKELTGVSGVLNFSGIARWRAIHQGYRDKGPSSPMHADWDYRGTVVPRKLTNGF